MGGRWKRREGTHPVPSERRRTSRRCRRVRWSWGARDGRRVSLHRHLGPGSRDADDGLLVCSSGREQRQHERLSISSTTERLTSINPVLGRLSVGDDDDEPRWGPVSHAVGTARRLSARECCSLVGRLRVRLVHHLRRLGQPGARCQGGWELPCESSCRSLRAGVDQLGPREASGRAYC